MNRNVKNSLLHPEQANKRENLQAIFNTILQRLQHLSSDYTNNLQILTISATSPQINLRKDVSGMDALKEIKKLESYQHIPIVAVTAYSSMNNITIPAFTKPVAIPFMGM